MNVCMYLSLACVRIKSWFSLADCGYYPVAYDLVKTRFWESQEEAIIENSAYDSIVWFSLDTLLITSDYV